MWDAVWDTVEVLPWQLASTVTSAAELTRTGIRDSFGRNQSTNRIDAALAALARAGKVRMEQEDTGGRPAERWKAVKL